MSEKKKSEKISKQLGDLAEKIEEKEGPVAGLLLEYFQAVFGSMMDQNEMLQNMVDELRSQNTAMHDVLMDLHTPLIEENKKLRAMLEKVEKAA